jgi:CheY-like chemotaxis protein
MPKSLLVADDSLTIRKVIGMIFATEDFQITSVDNGLEAISRARELRPDLVLADVTMPGRSGYEVCEAIKSDPDTQAVPVLLLAGTFEPFDQNRARAVKADDFIVKPFESQALLDKVRTLTGVPRPPETPRQTFKTESAASGARPAVPAPPSAAPRPPSAPAAVPANSTFPGGVGPPRPSAPAYSIGQAAPARPSVPAPTGGPRPNAQMPMGQPGFARPPSPAFAPNPAYSNSGIQGNPAAPQFRPPPSAIPRPGAGVAGHPSSAAGPPGYQYRPAAASPPAPRGPVPMPTPGFNRSAPAPMPRSPYPVAPMPHGAGPYGQQQARGPLQYARPPGSYEQPRYGEPPRAGPVAPVSMQRADGGEALLREALSKASREVIEKIVWEVVPQLAETIIREHLDQLVKDRDGRT